MILDTIKNAERYYATHPGFKAAFEWLRKQAAVRVPAGRQEIHGDRLYATVVTSPGRGQAGAKFETHRAYIDIQFMVEGVDVMGWRHHDSSMTGKGYDATKDCELYDDRPDIWVTVPAGHFAIFFPEDAHAPMAGEGPMYKLVAKVKV